MRFIVKSFESLSPRELYDLLQLRTEVFIVEQACAYLDEDGKDLSSLHVLLYNEEEQRLAAYARLLPQELSYPEASIGRVVVRRDLRENGYGRSLMEFCVEEARKRFAADEIVISAQSYLEKFYRSLGFLTEGSEYLEDDIPHRKMRLKKT